MKDPVWGTADPGEKVTVSVAGQTQRVTAGQDGRWMVSLDPMKAGSPLEMTIAGNNTVTLRNVAVGEVWLASGQSNMGFRMPQVMNAAAEMASANFPPIRFFTVRNKTAQEPQADTAGRWEVCSPTTARGFSAVAYFFARDLYASLGIPVGIIHSSWGGAPAEAWTIHQALTADPAEQLLVCVHEGSAAWSQRQAKRLPSQAPVLAGAWMLKPTSRSHSPARAFI